jgi:hypothetical protein
MDVLILVSKLPMVTVASFYFATIKGDGLTGAVKQRK